MTPQPIREVPTRLTLREHIAASERANFWPAKSADGTGVAFIHSTVAHDGCGKCWIRIDGKCPIRKDRP